MQIKKYIIKIIFKVSVNANKEEFIQIICKNTKELSFYIDQSIKSIEKNNYILLTINVFSEH